VVVCIVCLWIHFLLGCPILFLIVWGDQCEDNLLCGYVHCMVMDLFMKELWRQLYLVQSLNLWVGDYIFLPCPDFFYYMGWQMGRQCLFLMWLCALYAYGSRMKALWGNCHVWVQSLNLWLGDHIFLLKCSVLF